MGDNFLEEGCCLTCKVKEKGCWCRIVKCQNCFWYNGGKKELKTKKGKYFYGLKGKCILPSSEFDILEKLEKITETQKAYLFKPNSLNPIWIPKKAINIQEKIIDYEKGFKIKYFVSIIGWYLISQLLKLESIKPNNPLYDLFEQAYFEGYKGKFIEII
jgi:hypothetical protein